MDIVEELQKFKTSLALTTSKIDRWMGEEKQSILREFQSQAQTSEDSRRNLKQTAANLQALRRELQAHTSTVDTKLHEKELVTEELEHTRQSILKEQDLLIGQEKTVDDKLKELNRAVELFRDRMSFTFKKTSGNRLQVIFTNIDHKEPDSPFYFFMQVDGGKYLISGCEPAVPDLDALVEKLNSTNNLRAFVVAMRKRFKKMVEK